MEGWFEFVRALALLLVAAGLGRYTALMLIGLIRGAAYRGRHRPADRAHPTRLSKLESRLRLGRRVRVEAVSATRNPVR